MSTKRKDKITLIESFLLPLCGIPLGEFRPCLVKTYLYDKRIEEYRSHHIFPVLDKNSPNYAKLKEKITKNKNFKVSYNLDETTEVFVLSCIPSIKKDYDLILEGKYSKISLKAKDLILVDRDKNSMSRKILNKSEELRKEQEEKMGVTLPEEAELWSKININDFIYDPK